MQLGRAALQPHARRLGGRKRAHALVAHADAPIAHHLAREKFGITIFVLDDAFQHRRVRRDIDIVCVDATNPFGNEKTLPSGILREPLENLKRADAILITRANLVKDIVELKSKIRKYNVDCPIFVAENRFSRLINLEDFPAKTQKTQNETDNRQLTADRCLAFCALGNPNNFFDQLRGENFRLAATEAFPDHYYYRQKDIEKLIDKARRYEAKALLTTAKDAVKLKKLNFDLPCLVVESEMVFADEADDFRKWLEGRLKNRR